VRHSLALALSVVAGLGCDLLQPTVSQKKLEEGLAAWLVDHDLEANDIHCPEGERMEKGNVFECTCKVHETEIPVRVEVTDADAGTVEWKPKYTTITADKFLEEVRARPQFAGHDLDMSCTDKVLVSVPDSEWSCSFVDKGDGGKEYAASVVFSNGEGAHTIDIQPK
jgi:hypothetical protein